MYIKRGLHLLAASRPTRPCHRHRLLLQPCLMPPAHRRRTSRRCALLKKVGGPVWLTWRGRPPAPVQPGPICCRAEASSEQVGAHDDQRLQLRDQQPESGQLFLPDALEDVEERTHGAGGLGGPPPARWPVLSSRSAAEAVRLRQIETCGDERVTDRPLLIFCYLTTLLTSYCDYHHRPLPTAHQLSRSYRS